jgi:hypothetical protein
MQPERPVSRPPCRRSRCWLAALVLATISLSDGLAAIADQHPNVVFILADDVGREVLGCYGGVSYATPRIDRLAQEGVRFQHAYAMPMCPNAADAANRRNRTLDSLGREMSCDQTPRSYQGRGPDCPCIHAIVGGYTLS